MRGAACRKPCSPAQLTEGSVAPSTAPGLLGAAHPPRQAEATECRLPEVASGSIFLMPFGHQVRVTCVSPRNTSQRSVVTHKQTPCTVIKVQITPEILIQFL